MVRLCEGKKGLPVGTSGAVLPANSLCCCHTEPGGQGLTAGSRLAGGFSLPSSKQPGLEHPGHTLAVEPACHWPPWRGKVTGSLPPGTLPLLTLYQTQEQTAGQHPSHLPGLGTPGCREAGVCHLFPSSAHCYEESQVSPGGTSKPPGVGTL